MRGARRKRGLCLLVICRGVGNGDYAFFAGLLNKGDAAVQLGRNVHQTDGPAGRRVQPLEHLDIGIDDIFFRLRALFCLAEERPLHIDAAQHRAAGFAVDVGLRDLDDPRQDRLVKCHGRAAEAGDALAAQIPGHRFDVLRTHVAEIRALRAVNVDIHKAGRNVFSGNVQHVCACQRAGRGDARDLSVCQFHVRGHKARFFRKDKAVFQNHTDALPFYFAPPLHRAASFPLSI